MKKNVILFYGGPSTEHEISCRSARFVMNHLDEDKYVCWPVAVTKNGKWLPQDLAELKSQNGETLPILSSEAFADDDLNELLHKCPPLRPLLFPIFGFTHSESGAIPKKSDQIYAEDVAVFSTMHGTYGEDGAMQGLYEIAGIAWVGPDILGSAAAMDKVVAKQLVAAAGVPVVPWVTIQKSDWLEDRVAWTKQVGEILKYPVFVKPANLGSSVGINKVTQAEDLAHAIDEGFLYDEKILVEAGLDVREIEYAVFGDHNPQVTAPGEVASHGFYSYEEKYKDTSHTEVIVPAQLNESDMLKGMDYAKKVWRALSLYGLARIDFFLTKDTAELYFNEANTLPGFTSISQFPMLCNHHGLDGKALINCLLDFAWQRQSKKMALTRSL